MAPSEERDPLLGTRRAKGARQLHLGVAGAGCVVSIALANFIYTQQQQLSQQEEVLGYLRAQHAETEAQVTPELLQKAALVATVPAEAPRESEAPREPLAPGWIDQNGTRWIGYPDETDWHNSSLAYTTAHNLSRWVVPNEKGMVHAVMSTKWLFVAIAFAVFTFALALGTVAELADWQSPKCWGEEAKQSSGKCCWNACKMTLFGWVVELGCYLRSSDIFRQLLLTAEHEHEDAKDEGNVYRLIAIVYPMRSHHDPKIVPTTGGWFIMCTIVLGILFMQIWIPWRLVSTAWSDYHLIGFKTLKYYMDQNLGGVFIRIVPLAVVAAKYFVRVEKQIRRELCCTSPLFRWVQAPRPDDTQVFSGLCIGWAQFWMTTSVLVNIYVALTMSWYIVHAIATANSGNMIKFILKVVGSAKMLGFDSAVMAFLPIWGKLYQELRPKCKFWYGEPAEHLVNQYDKTNRVETHKVTAADPDKHKSSDPVEFFKKHRPEYHYRYLRFQFPKSIPKPAGGYKPPKPVENKFHLLWTELLDDEAFDRAQWSPRDPFDFQVEHTKGNAVRVTCSGHIQDEDLPKHHGVRCGDEIVAIQSGVPRDREGPPVQGGKVFVPHEPTKGAGKELQGCSNFIEELSKAVKEVPALPKEEQGLTLWVKKPQQIDIEKVTDYEAEEDFYRRCVQAAVYVIVRLVMFASVIFILGVFYVDDKGEHIGF
eukprot:TRINITY_DN70486_c0_g1_i1.p1 TRINITY_DN70486_c0_g1~~TRINITY_DN70486_c0_g1_i1.p1  ORF type:complete len:742 (+),score=150.75 TRINITY_DN70486_c0_g1_i1:107-2227(+)